MPRSLYSRLALVLLALFLTVGALTLYISVRATGLYQQEVNQKLNRELAQHIVAENTLIRDARVDQAALEHVFHMMMVINPAIELYLLDPSGKILAYSAEPGKVKRGSIDLAPVRQWLGGVERLPLLGDDPRDFGRRKAFSAAPIGAAGRPDGYLYVILGGEDYDSAAQALAGSYIMSASAWTLAGVVGLALCAGLVMFALLTGKLQRLARAMTAFRAGEQPDAANVNPDGDEIDRLHATFHDMARQIREQMNKLAYTDQLRRELMANVSHDLRTPLATLQGYIETVLIKDEKLDAAGRREYLETAIRHCQRLNKLVTELLELARLDASEVQPARETFSLQELVQDIVQKFRLKAREKNIRIEAELHSHLPFVNADIALIERVLENLIENALRYTPAHGLIALELLPGERGVQVRVRDSGCGIAPEELPRIFDRFYQLDKSRNSNPGSSGLGLAIAKRILELHGSGIAVDSAVNRGTTFAFELPAGYAS
jgi:signal transduction histidine kinase